jgi:hypothetical protein
VVCQGKVPRRPAAKLKRARANLQGRALKRRVTRIKRTYDRKLNRNRSIRRLRGAVKGARGQGYRLRPHGERFTLGTRAARRRIAFNKRLLAACRFRSIQAAVSASRNNDRVVIMPGVYTEPKSRAAPTNDPRCDGLEELNDRGQTGALSYAYQYTCPNDQNLIAVMGRVPNHGAVPQPPLDDRRGIPDEGACIRCNLQLEGSGVSADDVVIDAGRVASGNGGPGSVKDVTIRADRADGFVLRNLTARHAAEHDIYVPETDGARLERFKTFYNGEYGVLTFVADHHLIQDCEAVGSGDAGIYPGSSADVGEETAEPAERFSTELRRCDMHHSALGYSGTAANAVYVHDNNFYDNALGFSTDVFTAAGHPGFPQDSDLIERNNFFSNNFNPYVEGSDVEPTVPVPVGTGLWIAGGNNNTVRDNRAWERDGAEAGRHARSQRARLLVGSVPGQQRKLLVRQHWAGWNREQRHQRTARAAPSLELPAQRRDDRPRSGGGAGGLPGGDRVRRRGLSLVRDPARAPAVGPGSVPGSGDGAPRRSWFWRRSSVAAGGRARRRLPISSGSAWTPRSAWLTAMTGSGGT